MFVLKNTFIKNGSKRSTKQVNLNFFFDFIFNAFNRTFVIITLRHINLNFCKKIINHFSKNLTRFIANFLYFIKDFYFHNIECSVLGEIHF